MGVPRLFPWIRRKFPTAVTYFEEGSKVFDIDFLYIDANPLLYSAKAEIENTDRLNPYNCLNLEQKQEVIMRRFCEQLVHITDIVRPQRVLYISIDGVAPQSKQIQQRTRRYMNTSNNKEGNVNTTHFSPGTTFMYNLGQYINFFVRREMTINKNWHDVKVIFSSANVPGEGEHKIMEYIRGMPEKIRNTFSHCIYGPDGDLIMLTLTTYLEKIFLFKTDQYTKGMNYMIDMGYVRTHLPKAMGIEYRPKSSKGTVESQIAKYYDDCINDFVLLGFFVGNDFLPRIQMFIYLEDGLNTMIEHYSRFSNQGQDVDKLMTIGGQINLAGFTNLVEYLASDEIAKLLQQTEKVEKDLANIEDEDIRGRMRNQTLMKYISETKMLEKRADRTTNYMKQLDFSGYRQSYYAKFADKPINYPEKRSPSDSSDGVRDGNVRVFFSKSKDDDLRYLSNFAVIDPPLKIGDRQYSCVECFFQEEKYANGVATSAGAKAPNFTASSALSPKEAKSLGSRAGMAKQSFALDVKKWTGERYSVMRRAIAARFEQDERFRDISVRLVRDGQYLLHFERGPNPYWGGRVAKSSGKIVGENHLGKLIMEIAKGNGDPVNPRTKLISEPSSGSETFADIMSTTACHEYFTTILFIFLYYTDKLPSWTHSYKFYYPPLMTDFHKYLKNTTKFDFKQLADKLARPTKPPSPFTQLLSILPPAESHLLPVGFRKVFSDERIAAYYPDISKVEIDYEGKLKEHEGVVKLPFVDRYAIEAVTGSYKTGEYRRNINQSEVLALKFYNNMSVDFSNRYGTLTDIHIKPIQVGK
jgi:ribA/ribD-fused uncharacterized protein